MTREEAIYKIRFSKEPVGLDVAFELGLSIQAIQQHAQRICECPSVYMRKMKVELSRASKLAHELDLRIKEAEERAYKLWETVDEAKS